MLIIVVASVVIGAVRVVVHVIIHFGQRDRAVAVGVRGEAGAGARRKIVGEIVIRIVALLPPAALLMRGGGQDVKLGVAEFARVGLKLIRLGKGADHRFAEDRVALAAVVDGKAVLAAAAVDRCAGAAGAEQHDDLAGHRLQAGGQLAEGHVFIIAVVADQQQLAGIGAARNVDHAVGGDKEQGDVVVVSGGKRAADGALEAAVAHVVFAGDRIAAAVRAPDGAEHVLQERHVALVAVGGLPGKIDLADQQRAVFRHTVAVADGFRFLRWSFLADDDDLLAGFLIDGDQLDLLGPRRQPGQERAEHDQAQQEGQAAFHPVLHVFMSSPFDR